MLFKNVKKDIYTKLTCNEYFAKDINTVDKSLLKPSIYFQTLGYQMGFREIIYSGNKSYTSESIFNNIYSHEINENDIPLVEYYNLLIEVKSTTTQTNSTIEEKREANSTIEEKREAKSTIEEKREAKREANSIKTKFFDKIKNTLKGLPL